MKSFFLFSLCAVIITVKAHPVDSLNKPSKENDLFQISLGKDPESIIQAPTQKKSNLIDTLKKKDIFYFTLSTGFLFAGPGDYYIESDENSNGSYTLRSRLYSLGKGIPLTLSFGGNITNNIDLSLGITYHMGVDTKFYNSYYYNGTKVTSESNIKSSFAFLTPGVTLFIPTKHFELYTRQGISIGWGSKSNVINEEFGDINSFNYQTGLFEWKYKGGKAFGYTGALGIRFLSKTSSSFFTEFVFNSIGGSFTNGKKTKHMINGVSYLSTLPTYYKEIIYEDTITEGGTIDNNEPRKAIKAKESFNSCGIKFGILIFL
jgi:hypothetical protein